MAARQLRKTVAAFRPRGGQADFRENVTRAQRGLEQALEKIVCLHDPCAGRVRDLALAAQREQAGRQLGGRVGGDRAANGAAVADRGMGDMGQGARDERRVAGDLRRAFGLRVAHQRADLDGAVLHRNALERIEAVDVDQERRTGQPHVERGDQALAAGEQTRVGMLREEREGVVERPGFGVCERRRLHRATSPRLYFRCAYCGREWRGVNATKTVRGPACAPGRNARIAALVNGDMA